MKNRATVLTADGRSTASRRADPAGTTAFALLNPRGEGAGGITRTVNVYGAFGGGTATLQISTDGGPTWVDFEDETGTVVAFTASAARSLVIVGDDAFPNDGATGGVLLSINLASSTTPTVTFDLVQLR